MPNIRIALLLAATLSLGGCFLSDTSFITPDTADYPFNRMTYEAYPSERFVYVPGGIDTTDTLVLRDGLYRLTASGDGAAEILFQSAGGDLYLGQLMPGGENDPYVFFAAELDREAMEIRVWRSEALEGDFRSGATDCGDGNACLTSLSALEAIVRDAMAAGRPIAILDIEEIR